MTNIDDEWKQFLTDQSSSTITRSSNANKLSASKKELFCEDDVDVPKCEDLTISTKTKVLFLNRPVDIQTVFWKIPIVEYWKPIRGVVKKQMKIVSKTQEEYDAYKQRLETVPHYTENIIKQINNPEARRIKFKDERKLTVGISKKDIMNCRGKVKNAFYNCFAMILRFQQRDPVTNSNDFKEIHVKIFNTGKMEIPGIVNKTLLEDVKKMILEILRTYCEATEEEIDFIENEKEDSVLINSNFNCGFYIQREQLHSILRSDKYKIESAFDPCSYPGVKCKFYFNHDYGLNAELQTGVVSKEDNSQKMSELNDNKKYTEVSFMIFRTGSCLIVGNCSESILHFIYDFIKNLLSTEYLNIRAVNESSFVKIKKTKTRTKQIFMTKEYMNTIESLKPSL
jgi:hypothetical protein